ncbi:hypothetical protein BZA70DRAFT_271887 [Myxozyma melibiosi]|uniref:NADH:flavin oxidoreductase/NADH oxidase N-terminal domain-containing protein n=1 Tax=Myxozyma melibiosi TaxID=54550 RepID=A0ABR1FF87_9ASCO
MSANANISTATKALRGTALFSPVKIGNMNLLHRVCMAPMGRLRATEASPDEWVCGDIAAQYYGQRATKGGFQITESTPISRLAAGYPRIAGIYTQTQIESWKQVTQAVHAKEGYIFCQIWHAGRATIPEYLNGEIPVSSYASPLPGSFIGPGPKEYKPATPRELSVSEIKEIVDEFAAAAHRSLEAGFDGVEIHGANGYLLDQFMHDNVNKRTDGYGGSIENRCRFPIEVISAVGAAIGGSRVGIRLTPFNYWHGTKDSDPMRHWRVLCEKIASLPKSQRPAYVHMIRPEYDELLSGADKIKSLAERANSEPYSLKPFRDILKAADIRFLAAGNYTRESALPTIETDLADAVVFGRPFISNPDLPRRLAEGFPLTEYDRATFYGADPPEKGYVDYKLYQE